jgi:hypothetical protein
MGSFKSSKQKAHFENRLRNACAWIQAGKGKSKIHSIHAALNGMHRELAIEIICESFRITREEFDAGKRFEPERFVPTPEWEAVQRRGFHEGAKVPGSRIRKIDK